MSSSTVNVCAALVLLQFSAIPVAFGWGGYGHQQINVAAIELLGKMGAANKPFADCLSKNTDLVQRLSVTPDFDWKMTPAERSYLFTLNDIAVLRKEPSNSKALYHFKKLAEEQAKAPKKAFSAKAIQAMSGAPAAPATLDLLEKEILAAVEMKTAAEAIADLEPRMKASSGETATHIFELDGYLPEPTPASIQALPSDSSYAKAFPEYKTLVLANLARIEKENKRKLPKDSANPTPTEIARFGTTPWRVGQLYELGRQALANGDVKTAIINLSLMAHYVGDITQPYHVTMDFDGEHQHPAAKGIHSAFESDMLESFAKSKGASLNKVTRYWSSLEPTNAEVIAFALEQAKSSGSALPALSAQKIIPEMLRLSAESYQLIPLLAEVYSKALAEKKPQFENQIPPTIQKYLVKNPVNGKPESTMTLAQERLAAAALTTARLWAAAFKEAGGTLKACATYSFIRDEAVKAYMSPSYVPEEAGQQTSDN